MKKKVTLTGRIGMILEQINREIKSNKQPVSFQFANKEPVM